MSYVSAVNSQLLYGALPHVPADGIARGVIKIRLRDDQNMPVAGRQVALTADNPAAIITQPPVTDANGLAIGYVISSTPGAVKISGQVVPSL